MRPIIVFCSEEFREVAQSELFKNVGFNWKESKRAEIICFVGRSTRDVRLIQKRVNFIAESRQAADIVLAGVAKVTTPPHYYSIKTLHLKNSQELSVAIKTLSVNNGLDIYTERYEFFKNKWEPALITRDDIVQWTEQFGIHQWIAHRLLYSLTCLSTDDLLSHLGLEQCTASHLCFYAPETDRTPSGSPLANAASRRLQRANVVQLPLSPSDQLENNLFDISEGLIVEDCSLSGFEACRMLSHPLFVSDVALGLAPGTHSANTWKLRYAVITNGAANRLRAFINDRQLQNVQLETESALQLRAFTEHGAELLSKGLLYDNTGVLTKRNEVVHLAFADTTIWPLDLSKKAKTIVKNIGAQLYRNYWKSDQNNRDLRPKRFFDDCGLGRGGLALGLVLARSVPKSTLPIFWGRGPVELNGRRFEWKPLFG